MSPPKPSLIPPPEARPDRCRLLELIDAMAGQPVLMVVDLVADRFITGEPKRISREAPVLILRFLDEQLVPGGGANAVANVRALGGRPLPVGIVGDDSEGAKLVAALDRIGVDTAGIFQIPGYRTPTKTRILGGGHHSIKQQIVRYDVEQAVPFAEVREQLLARLEPFSGQAAVAILSDYGYGTVDPELLPEVRRRLQDGGRILADSRYRLGDFRGLDGATPNEEEALALESAPGDSAEDDDAWSHRAGAALAARLQASFILITRGSRGMTLVEAGDESGSRAAFLPVHGTDQVADVTGAGDTVIGTFALALAAGGSPLEAALLANYAGGIVVMKAGTATLSPEELRRAVETQAELRSNLIRDEQSPPNEAPS